MPARWPSAGWFRFTLNGFPQGDFHEPIVKHRVYCPTWWEHARAEYTLDLITALDALLPTGLEGSISTLPIAWGYPAPSREQMMLAAKNLDQVIQTLRAPGGRNGTPDICLSGAGAGVRCCSAAKMLCGSLRKCCGRSAIGRRHSGTLRVCHDICHAAVMFEDQQDVLTRYAAQGIRVGKVQVSSAVCVDFDALGHVEQQQAKQTLASFAEDRYLHQTAIRSASDGEIQFLEDLPQALRKAPAKRPMAGAFPRADLLGTIRPAPDHARRHSQVPAGGRSCIPTCDTSKWKRMLGVSCRKELQHAELADGIAAEMRWFADLGETVGCAKLAATKSAR